MLWCFVLCFIHCLLQQSSSQFSYFFLYFFFCKSKIKNKRGVGGQNIYIICVVVCVFGGELLRRFMINIIAIDEIKVLKTFLHLIYDIIICFQLSIGWILHTLIFTQMGRLGLLLF